MERIMIIVVGLDEEHLSSKLIGIGLLPGIGLRAAMAHHVKMPLLEMISDVKINHLELDEILLQNREINKINEIFSITAPPHLICSDELVEIIRREDLPFFRNKRETNNWKRRNFSQTKFNRQVKVSKWQTCRSRL